MSRSRSVAASVALGLGLGLLTAPLASGQVVDRPTLPEDVAIAPPVIDAGPVPLPTTSTLRSAPRAEGMASPGLRVVLDGSDSSGGKLWYRWLQTRGPKVTLTAPDQAVTRFTVPTGADALEFVLVVGDDSGVDAKPLSVEVEDPGRSADGSALHADAGDDQSAKVGRMVTLNGVRSEPRGKLRYRWLQVGGPKVKLPATDGPTCSFVPPSAGLYQFALVVSTGTGLLSEPGTVTVAVGGMAARNSSDPMSGASMAIDELARVALASIEGGSMYADDLSQIFDTIADRMETYRNYTDAANEMTRRLDAVVPRDKERRAVWVEHLFAPVMARVVAGMKAEGVDLTRPEGQTRSLSHSQRAHLAEQFRYTAAGLRSTRTLR